MPEPMTFAVWPFIAYADYFHDEPDGPAERVYVPTDHGPAVALTEGRNFIHSEDAFDGSFVLRITGRGRWRESTFVENKIAWRAEDHSVMLPCKRGGHEFYELTVIPMHLAATNPPTKGADE